MTDQGRQFTSDLWSALTVALGITKKKTTSYHPQSNGMIERQHRTLKDRLISRACASGSGSWMDHLPFVLLGLRSSIRGDSACSPSDLLYGAPLRLPGPMLDRSLPSSGVPATSDFVARLRTVMGAAVPLPVKYHGSQSQSSRVDPSLVKSTHVFLRVDEVRRPLVPPYDGPFPVLSRTPKTFVILRRDRPVTVSVDQLKPAFFLPESEPPDSPSAGLPPVPDPLPSPVPVPAPPTSDVASSPDVDSVRTASGRLSRPVLHFQA